MKAITLPDEIWSMIILDHAIGKEETLDPLIFESYSNQLVSLGNFSDHLTERHESPSLARMIMQVCRLWTVICRQSLDSSMTLRRDAYKFKQLAKAMQDGCRLHKVRRLHLKGDLLASHGEDRISAFQFWTHIFTQTPKLSFVTMQSLTDANIYTLLKDLPIQYLAVVTLERAKLFQPLAMKIRFLFLVHDTFRGPHIRDFRELVLAELVALEAPNGRALGVIATWTMPRLQHLRFFVGRLDQNDYAQDFFTKFGPQLVSFFVNESRGSNLNLATIYAPTLTSLRRFQFGAYHNAREILRLVASYAPLTHIYVEVWYGARGIEEALDEVVRLIVKGAVPVTDVVYVYKWDWAAATGIEQGYADLSERLQGAKVTLSRNLPIWE